MRFFRWAALALIVLYLVVSPAIIRRGLARDQYVEWLTPETPAWEGRVELWHIADFKVYLGSVTHYLEDRAKAYGRLHPGVHIDVIGLTPAQYESRLGRGAFPDAYSFPAGLLYAEQLRPADYARQEYRGRLVPAEAEGEAYAVPWLMSGYFLAANTQRLAKYRVELPESADTAFLQSALSLDAESPQLYMPAVLAARAGLTGALATAEDFTKGRAMLAVLDARALGELTRAGGMPLSFQPYAPYTDQVQYIGAARQTDRVRAAVTADFAAFLLSEDEQNRLSTLGALPVTRDASPVYGDSTPEKLYEAMTEPLAPEPFSYQRHGGALAEEAARALAGDGHAKKSFEERMAVVENGELW